MKFLFRSWLRPLAGDFARSEQLIYEEATKKIDTVFDKVFGSARCTFRLLVSKGELPIVNCPCSGDFDNVVKLKFS